MQLQRTAGNAALGRMYGAATPLRPPADVTTVRSFHVEAAQGAVRGQASLLAKKLRDRVAVIDKLIALSKPSEAKKLNALRVDREKTVEDIVAAPDSPWVAAAHRKVISQEHAKLLAKERTAASAEKAWHRFDQDIIGAAPALPAGLNVRDLKALIAQESGDLTITDARGDKAGVAQMGVKEAKEAGMDPKDRLDPAKAIAGAARLLAVKLKQLGAGNDKALVGLERRKFLYAAYNAGAETIRQAQDEARARGLDPLVWDNLASGQLNSPFAIAVAKINLRQKPKDRLDPAKKLAETTAYVKQILERQ